MLVQGLVQLEIDRPKWMARRYFRKKLCELRDEHGMIDVRQLIAANNDSAAIRHGPSARSIPNSVLA